MRSAIMTMRSAIMVSCLLVTLASCYSPVSPGAGPSAEPTVLSEIAAPELPDVPVDGALMPVSRSKPSPDAKAVLDLCLRPGEISLVVGMARLASARDVGKYMLTGGKEPELNDDSPVWLVQLRGKVVYRSWTNFNPVCMVKDGQVFNYAPYGGVSGGKTWYPPEDFVQPTLALPPLAP